MSLRLPTLSKVNLVNAVILEYNGGTTLFNFNTEGTCPVMTKQHLTFCQRIIDHCQQQQWYGPDGERRPNPVAPGFIDQQGVWHEPDEHIFGYRGYFDVQGRLQMRALTHDPRIGFEFPPATEKQL